ncbi:MAG: alpha-amylase family glycosyl hydrolase [Myxococcota bacterium]|nr:alpha-amylase [Deltaproteobacteria bacterium]MDQ3335360.1 alpha-amylase family glycosyl hydrolase [Myxococcota bacterium]
MTHPLLYEVHTRQWLAELGVQALSDVRDETLDALSAIGVTHLWLMGVWPTGPRSRREAFVLAKAYDEALPGWREEDVAGSPYAIARYEVADEFGGDAALASLRTRLSKRGIRVILDFVPNHVALDHPWVNLDLVMRDGNTVVHGKDPYFPGWTDTAQLEYRRAATRVAMRDVLLSIAARCDGVRCDMAMLVLPDVFEKTWQHVPCEEAAADFWGGAIRSVRQAHPDFVMLAEAYWGLERRLCELGFDYVYDKELYDRLVHDRPYEVAPHVYAADNVRHVHFLENHDEPRVAALPLDLHRAAALLVMSLPGMRFLHHGQAGGARRFARIQLRRRADEPDDEGVRALYAALLSALVASSVGRGDARLLAPRPAWEGNPTAGCFVIVKWAHDLVVVNLAPHRAQCRVDVGEHGKHMLVDRLGDERWERDLSEPLFLDLPPQRGQLFALQRMT